MYLVFDATPIQKPANYKAPFSDTFAWPRLIHLSWILLNQEYKPMEDFDCIVKPDGWAISDKILDYAKIDQEDIDKKASPIDVILTQFTQSVEKAQYLVAHNMNMNESVISAEYLRTGLSNPIFKKERLCLMQESTYYCQLPSKGQGYKWPSLTELHAVCFQQRYSPSGNARADVIAAARCFIKLMKSNALEDFFED